MKTYLEVTREQLDLHMPHVGDGDVITVNGCRSDGSGNLVPCAKGEETKFTVRIVQQTNNKDMTCQ